MRRSALVVLTVSLATTSLRAASPTPGTGHWPQFRGTNAAGVADGANLPDAWDAAAGKGVVWKTRIPGLAHSSPVVWGDQVFVTTAVSSLPNATFKPGLYGEGTASEDTTVQKWQLLSLDRKTGTLQWQRTAVRPVRSECIPAIHRRQNSCSQWNLFPLESMRIAGSIPFFMVREHDRYYGIGKLYAL